MYEVVMKGLWDIRYAVIKGVNLDKATEIFDYVVSTCSHEYFSDLFVREVAIESKEGIVKSVAV